MTRAIGPGMTLCRRAWLPLGMGMVALCYVAISSSLQAATILVTSTADTTGGTECTIRDAVSAANSDTAVGGCTPGNGVDTIMLMENSIYTLTQIDNTTTGANGLPVISSAIIFEGRGATLTRVPGSPDFRFFFSTGTLTLREMEISNGSAIGDTAGRDGGVIRNSGNLVVEGCTLVGNSATAVANGDGGAIGSFGGQITIVNSTFSGNASARYGGAIYNNNGDVLVLNSTILGNSAGLGGGIGILDSASVSLANSLVMGNEATMDGPDIHGDVFSNGFNLVGTLIGSVGLSASEVATDPIMLIVSQSLQDNGGRTRTHALVGGSMAIDRAENGPAPPTDQRGMPRQGDPDIGAFEFQAGPPPPIANVPALSSTGLVLFLTALVIIAVSNLRRRSRLIS